MPPESHAARAVRASALFAGLRRTYPDAHCELRFSNPLELLIATILSAQCADLQVNRATETLFARHRTAADYAAAPLSGLEDHLRRLGLFRNKARNIQATAKLLVERHGGEVPADLDALVQLPGVGRKTANVVLGNAFGIASGVVVDTHVARLSQRLRLTRHEDPVRIEQDLMKLLPRDEWNWCSHALIWHGRRRCGARKPDCAGCEIARHCPSSPTPPSA